MIHIVSAATLLALLAFPALAQQRDFSKVEEKVTPLGHGAYWILGEGGNTTVAIANNGVFLVDDQFAPLSQKLMAAVANLTKEPIRYVINTHFHGDHSGGNENFAKAGATLVAQDNVRKRLSTENFMSLNSRRIPPAPRDAWPTITYRDALTLYLDGQTAELHHPNTAHTDGDTFIYFPEANVLAAGDAFTTIGYPFIDMDNGGTLDGIIQFAGAMIAVANDATVIVPGHGVLQKRSDLMAYKVMLEAARARVKKLVAEGKDEDAVVAAKPMADFDAKWAGNLGNADHFVRSVYQAIAGG